MSVALNFKELKTTFFSSLSSFDCSQICISMKEECIDANEKIYQKNDRANKLFLVIEGSVELKIDDKTYDEVKKGFFGEEIAIGDEGYRFDAIAKTSTKILSIDKEILEDFFDKNLRFKQHLIESLLSHISKISKTKAKEIKKEKLLIKPVIGWVLAIILPIVMYFFVKDLNISWEEKNLILLVITSSIIWLFSLVPYFIPAVLLIFGITVLKIAPLSVSMSGFSSNSFFMILSVFAIGTAIIESNLFYRLMLILYRIFPASRYTNAFILLLISILLAMVVPAYLGRLIIIISLAAEMNSMMKYPDESKKASFLLILPIYFSISNLFLTGSFFNFVIYGLFSEQMQHECTWLYWAKSSSVVFAVLIIFAICSIYLIYRKTNIESHVNGNIKEIMKKKLKILGPMTNNEWLVLIGLCIFIGGILSASVYNIHPAWIAFFVLFVFLVLQLLNKKAFQNKVQWSLVIFIGLILGLVNTIKYIGAMEDIINSLSFVSNLMNYNFYIFALVILLIISVGKILGAIRIIQMILLVLLFPICIQNHVNEWLIAFLIIHAVNIEWFLPIVLNYQYLIDFMSDKGGINKRLFLTFNYIYNVVMILAIYISMPFWKSMGYF